MNPINSDSNNNFATKKDLDAHFEKLNLITSGVIIILGLGFVTLLIAAISPIIDAWRFRSSTYENLVDQVNNQNSKIDILTQELQNKGYVKK
jgi:hypothetical protein